MLLKAYFWEWIEEKQSAVEPALSAVEGCGTILGWSEHNTIHHGVEQAFMPAVLPSKKWALAPEEKPAA